MKNIVLIVFCSLISMTAFSQVEKGDMNLTFGGTYSGNEASKTGVIYGKVGYFVTPNIEAGAQPTILLGDFGGYGVGLYGTYNFLTADAKLLPYAGAKIDFLAITGDFEYNQTDLGLYVGSKYFLTEMINIDGNFSISPNIANSEDLDLGTTFRFTIGIGFILGKIN
jgi:hypothetical protein